MPIKNANPAIVTPTMAKRGNSSVSVLVTIVVPVAMEPIVVEIVDDIGTDDVADGRVMVDD